eukprot:7952699-Alexandrium_andersonii.AAC.1
MGREAGRVRISLEAADGRAIPSMVLNCNGLDIGHLASIRCWKPEGSMAARLNIPVPASLVQATSDIVGRLLHAKAGPGGEPYEVMHGTVADGCFSALELMLNAECASKVWGEGASTGWLLTQRGVESMT